MLPALLIGLVLLSACSKKTSPSKSSGGSDTGYASYYGDEFNGRKTANGEIFRQSNLTAAHKKLAFGTHYDVVLCQYLCPLHLVV